MSQIYSKQTIKITVSARHQAIWIYLSYMEIPRLTKT